MKGIQQAQFMLEAISLSAYGVIHNEGGARLVVSSSKITLSLEEVAIKSSL